MNKRQLILKYFSLITMIFWIANLLAIGKMALQDIRYTFILFLLIAPTIFILSASLIKLLGIKKFDDYHHFKLMFNFIRRRRRPSVDVFLPICGESDQVVTKTWQAVKNLDYKKIKVYVLDDKKELSKKLLAKQFGFKYITRENGEFKKAGNLRNAFNQTKSEYILILDADFQPEPNFLFHTLPYLVNDSQLGIVQTPQAFKYKEKKGLEQGAGNIQDFFYSIVQPARDSFGGAICVGTNAVYRRSALEKIGGNVLIEHSEDVWTGFALLKAGYQLKYIPLNLAFGDCPDNPYAYFKQQTRWAQGSSSLISSSFFWTAKLSIMQRLSYISGFMFYVYSALILLFPLATLINQERNADLLVIIGTYGIISMMITKFLIYKDSNLNTVIAHCLATWSYTWALFNKFILKKNEAWQPTGSSLKVSSIGYTVTLTCLYTYTLLISLFALYVAIKGIAWIFVLYTIINALVHLTTSFYLINLFIKKVGIKWFFFPVNVS